MIDIDFRYVTRPKDTGGEHFQTPPMENVLQWRKKILTAPLRYPEEPKIEWTDWQDVRTEEA